MLQVKVLNDYSEPVIPPGFLRALGLISPKLSVLWHGGAQRWLIVTYDVPRSEFRDGYVVDYVVSKDDQYAPLSEDVLYFLRKAIFERDKFCRKYDVMGIDHHLQELDQENQEKADKAVKYKLDGYQQFQRKAHKFDTTKTFI